MEKNFRQAGLAFAEQEALELVMAATGKTRTDIILGDSSFLASEDLEKVSDFEARRLSGEPVDAILGWREFFGRRFKVTKDVLSPREDTENLVRLALNALKVKKSPVCLDLGTGSGAIIVSLLAERQDLKGLGVDISVQALNIAQENADLLGVSDRVEFIQSSWFENVTGSYDLIVSNPPYISDEAMAGLESEVLEYDPDISLRGGRDGLTAYRQITGTAKDFLAPGGSLWVEIGYDQSEAVQSLFEKNQFIEIEVHKDLSGRDRCVGGKKPS
ncbi:peptide chain release factor N(5)-glutamine methyltransferase [Litorimonas sp.]|uniref:peptide chain release factor N(5)-glutamine methyltransferase n=1 Tax=Litorimonas sp. TaxID=1892381 RepID=UPI003A8499BF